MSFGFSIGDIIAVSALARSIWGRFRDSSDQFNAIQSEQATSTVAAQIQADRSNPELLVFTSPSMTLQTALPESK